MCLAVPLRVVEVDRETLMGVVERAGIKRRINISLVENVRPGDFVLVHAGFAISILDEKEAQKTLETLEELVEKMDENIRS